MLEIKMKLQRSVLATALTAALAMGAAGQASAYVYAGSSLTVQDLLINFQNASGGDAQNGVVIRSFNFNLTNTAQINGFLSGSAASCGGTLLGNNCGLASPVLNALAANAPGSAFNRVDNQTTGDGTFTWFGTTPAGNWSNSDSVIYESELSSLGANPTHTDQIAESRIDTATSAAASSEIQSVTGFTLNFSIAADDPVSMVMSFLADPDMHAAIFGELGAAFGAQANMSVTAALTKDGIFGTGAEWAPDGTATNNCNAGGVGVTCVETADTQALNLSIGTTSNNTDAFHSFDPNIAGLTQFGMEVGGLTAGNWSLTLNAKTSTNLTRQNPIPEPSSIALAGLAMLGLGIAARRRKV